MIIFSRQRGLVTGRRFQGSGRLLSHSSFALANADLTVKTGLASEESKSLKPSFYDGMRLVNSINELRLPVLDFGSNEEERTLVDSPGIANERGFTSKEDLV